jgi:hypothetical protein
MVFAIMYCFYLYGKVCRHELHGFVNSQVMTIIMKYQSLQKYADLSRIMTSLLHWGQISSMILLGTEPVSNDCLSSEDTC